MGQGFTICKGSTMGMESTMGMGFTMGMGSTMAYKLCAKAKQLHHPETKIGKKVF